MPSLPTTPVLTSPVSEETITLSYIYHGFCPNCSSVVETLEQDIEIDNKNHHFVLAYCLNCKQQLKSKEVSKLP